MEGHVKLEASAEGGQKGLATKPVSFPLCHKCLHYEQKDMHIAFLQQQL